MLSCTEAADYVENKEDVQKTSDLVDQIQEALTDYQVSRDPKQFPSSPSSRWLVQTMKQQVILDLGIKLIVSYQTWWL